MAHKLLGLAPSGATDAARFGDIPLAANPTGSIGLTAVNGSATSWARSDATHALDVSIVPTWTGLHTFNGKVVIGAPASGVALTVSAVSGNYGVVINTVSSAAAVSVAGSAATQLNLFQLAQSGQTSWIAYQPASSNDLRFFAGADRVVFTAGGNVTINAPTSGAALTVAGVASNAAAVFSGAAGTGVSAGVFINAGTNSSDYALAVANAANTHQLAKVWGDGSFVIGYNGTAGVLSGAAAGNVTIVAPSSGDALGVTGVAGSYAATLNGAAASNGLGLQVVGGYTGSGNTSLVRLGDVNNTNGVNLLLTGNGATTPSKYIRVINGLFEVLNSGYTAVLMTIGDAGGVQLGAPTGGDKGAGTLNVAGALYVNGVAAGAPSLTATYIAYGNGSNAITGTSDFTWTDSTLTLSLGGAGTTPISITGNVASSGVGAAFSIVGSVGASGSAGGAVTVIGGFGAGTGFGGALNLLGGENNRANSATGGAVNITGGGSGGFPGSFGNAYTGGAVNITGGTGSGTQTSVSGGNVTIKGGAVQLQFTSGSTTATAGYISLQTQTNSTITTGGFTGAYTERLRIDGTGQWLVGGAAGSAGNVLTSAGANTPPTWQAPGGVTSIAGTAGQITLSASSGAVTVSTPFPPTSLAAPVTGINTTATVLGKLQIGVPVAGDVYELVCYGTCVSTVANAATFSARYGSAGTTADTAFASLGLAGGTSGGTVPFTVTVRITVVDSTHMLGTLHCISSTTGGISSTNPAIAIPAGPGTITGTAAFYVSVTFVTAATTTTCTFTQANLSKVR